jgi:putative sigma-54 modulation protein
MVQCRSVAAHNSGVAAAACLCIRNSRRDLGAIRILQCCSEAGRCNSPPQNRCETALVQPRRIPFYLRRFPALNCARRLGGFDLFVAAYEIAPERKAHPRPARNYARLLTLEHHLKEERTMIFFVRAVADFVTKAKLKRESERRLQFATDRFQDHIREIGVVFRDVNGPRGGVDKQCRLIAMLRRGGTLEIEETRSDFVDAISRAAKRLRLVLTRRIGGKNARKTLRHVDRRAGLRRWEVMN